MTERVRMPVAVIGPGKVGTALAMALPEDGYEVVAVAGRGAGALERFRRAVPTAVPLAPADAVARAELILLTVPDDELVPTVRALTADGAVREGGRWVHCAGGHGLAPLRPVVSAGARAAACHPAQTFPDPEAGRRLLPGSAWAVTAEPGDAEWAGRLVTDLGGLPQPVREEDRVLYHAALSIGSNGASAILTLARDLLLAAGVAEPERFLQPPVTASVQRASAEGVVALTGPVRRGDVGTVAAHLRELDGGHAEAAEAYRGLARLALAYARRAGLDPEAAAEMEKILA